MIPFKKLLLASTLGLCAVVPVMMSGCTRDRCQTHCDYDDDDDCEEGCPPRPAQFPPLGHLSDPIWQKQERNAEASDFAVHEHEFEGNSARLNKLGESHVRQIAARICNVPFKVLVQPSSMSEIEGTHYNYPIHPNPELDRKRRKVVVHALLAMGVTDAEDRVVISHTLTPGFEQFEGENAYLQGFSNQGGDNFGNGGGGFGGLGGGFGGIGGLGGGAGFF